MKVRFECWKHLLDANVVTIRDDVAEFKERDEGGQSVAHFKLEAETLLLRPLTGPHQVSWSAEKKCADGALLVEKCDGVHLHVVELKSLLTNKEFKKAIRQFKGMYISALILNRFVGLENFSTISCYLGYASLNVDFSKTADLSLLKVASLGDDAKAARDWQNQAVTLIPGVIAPLSIRPRDENSVVDFGAI